MAGVPLTSASASPSIPVNLLHLSLLSFPVHQGLLEGCRYIYSHTSQYDVQTQLFVLKSVSLKPSCSIKMLSLKVVQVMNCSSGLRTRPMQDWYNGKCGGFLELYCFGSNPRSGLHQLQILSKFLLKETSYTRSFVLFCGAVAKVKYFTPYSQCKSFFKLVLFSVWPSLGWVMQMS